MVQVAKELEFDYINSLLHLHSSKTDPLAYQAHVLEEHQSNSFQFVNQYIKLIISMSPLLLNALQQHD